MRTRAPQRSHRDALRRTTRVLVGALLLAACGAAHTPAPVTLVPAGEGLALSGVDLPGGYLANLAESKARIIAFHDSGEWDRQITAIADAALLRLDHELASSRRPAIVLDIDDTALSTFDIQRRLGFGWVPSSWDAWVESAVARPHPAILALYRYAIGRGVAVLFVTGRREHLRVPTTRQLRGVGYDRWLALYMKPDDYAESSVVPYKSGRRKAIEEQGFDILINVGDQWSDLEGGFARAIYKLPNPMYYRR